MKLTVFLSRLCVFAALSCLVFSCAKDSPAPLPFHRKAEVWLHRVNTTGKAQHFRSTYPGFELDVHFDTSAGTFIVKHDATDTSTLTLGTWLGAISNPAELGYWLDFKNLDPQNAKPAFTELLRIRQEFSLYRHTIVVESGYAPALPVFDTLNFRISYYIPWFYPTGVTPEEEETWRSDILTKTAANGIQTISGYYFQYELMDKWFHRMNKLLWYLDSYDPEVKDSITAIVQKDPAVEILLVAEEY